MKKKELKMSINAGVVKQIEAVPLHGSTSWILYVYFHRPEDLPGFDILRRDDSDSPREFKSLTAVATFLQRFGHPRFTVDAANYARS